MLRGRDEGKYDVCSRRICNCSSSTRDSPPGVLMASDIAQQINRATISITVRFGFIETSITLVMGKDFGETACGFDYRIIVYTPKAKTSAWKKRFSLWSCLPKYVNNTILIYVITRMSLVFSSNCGKLSFFSLIRLKCMRNPAKRMQTSKYERG